VLNLLWLFLFWGLLGDWGPGSRDTGPSRAFDRSQAAAHLEAYSPSNWPPPPGP